MDISQTNKRIDSMEAFYVEESAETPGIILDPKNNKFKIWGRSFPEDAKVFYDPVLNWFEEYVENPNDETILQFNFDYYNSASSTRILNILNILEKINSPGKSVKVEWNYLEIDDDTLEAGKELEEMVDIDFSFIPYQDSEEEE
jgi:hypothetical protein